MRHLQFVEAHATSTQVGDATEVQALAEALQEFLPAGKKVPLGSVKANIGHTLEVAGIAGLLKTVLAIVHQTIPPAVGVQQPNPKIDWGNVPFSLPKESYWWPTPAAGVPRRGAVNAFGIGGLNTHVVLDEYLPDAGSQAGKAPVRRQTEVIAHPRQEAMAILGASAIVPDALSLAAYWDLLDSGATAVSEIPAERWRVDLGYHPQEHVPWHSTLNVGGFVRGFQYDWRKHKVPPKQIAKADPLQFMLLDAVDQAVADAGFPDGKFDRKKTGVIVGTCFGGEFSKHHQAAIHLPVFRRTLMTVLLQRGVPRQEVEALAEVAEQRLLTHLPTLEDETGSFTPSTLASRVTKAFDLMGGAASVDCDAAAAVGALDLCRQMLWTGRCDMMICAAGQRSLGLSHFEKMSWEGVLATDSNALPYEQGRDGRIPAEGVGVMVLKRLSDAVRDGDRIRAVIRSIGNAKTVQLDESVELAVRRGYSAAGVAADDVRVVISAASGQVQNDQAELSGLDCALSTSTRRTPILLGTVAGQLGDMRSGLGMASILKAMLAIDKRSLPEVPRAKALVSWLKDKSDTLQLVDRTADLSEWPSCLMGVGSHDGNRLAYYVTLEEPPRADSPESQQESRIVAAAARGPEASARICRLSGASRQEVLAEAGRLAKEPHEWFENSKQSFSKHDGYRLAVVAETADELGKSAALVMSQGEKVAARDALMDRGVYLGKRPERPPKVAFVFPGQASQYPDMLRTLIEEFPPATRAWRDIEVVLSDLGYPSFAEIAWESPDTLGSGIFETQLAVLVADCVMLAAVQALGASPLRVCGHSFGELTALVAAGSWGFTEAVKATYGRCEAIRDTVPGGATMMATTAPLEVVKEICRVQENVFIANHNAPQQIVLGGLETALSDAAHMLEERGFKARGLSVTSPFHTPLMRGVEAPLAACLETIGIDPPSVPVLSSVSNRYVAEPDEIRRNLARQMIEPVLYVDLVERFAREGMDILIEVGPQQILTRLNRQILAGGQVLSIGSDDKKRNGWWKLLNVQACLEVQDALATSPARADSLESAGQVAEQQSLTVAAELPALRVTEESAGVSEALVLGQETGRVHRATLRGVLRRGADQAWYPGGQQPLSPERVDAYEAGLSSAEIEELRGVAAGSEISYTCVLALAARAFNDGPDAVAGVPLLAHQDRSKSESADGTTRDRDAVPQQRGAEDAVACDVIDPGAYLAAIQEADDPATSVCRRFIPRMLRRELQDQETVAGQGKRDALIYGTGPLATSLQAAWQRSGGKALIVEPSADAGQALGDLDRLCGESTWRHLFMLPLSVDAGQADLMGAFFVCQRWVESLRDRGVLAEGVVTAVTNLGGDFGLSGSASRSTGGALTGLMKALHVEEGLAQKPHGLRSLAIDFDDSFSEAETAEAILREMRNRTGEVEVGYLDKERYVVRCIREDVSTSHSPEAVEGGEWIVTGGARGVTALVARQLAQQFGWKLHLLGSSSLPEIPAKWRNLSEEETKALRMTTLREARERKEPPLVAWGRIEKAIEIDANLRAYEQAGVDVVYHQCDLSDRRQLAGVLDRIRRTSGELVGILHGAGFEKSCRFKNKKQELVERTFSAKVEGATSLMELTQQDPLRYFIAFGSTSGRLGSHGQADYCAANDMLAKQVNRFRHARDGCRAVTFHWHAWDEVGMAVRPEIAGVLKGFGLKFMPSQEGVQFVAQELKAGLPEPEVLVTEWSQYRRLCPQSVNERQLLDDAVPRSRDAIENRHEVISELPLVDDILVWERGEKITTLTHYDPEKDPFLLQHTLRKKPVLPLVCSLEAFAEAGQLLTGAAVREFRDLQIESGLRFFSDRIQSAESRLELVSSGRLECELACDFVNQRGVTMQQARPYLRGQMVLGDPRFPREFTQPKDPHEWSLVEYPDNDPIIYHGPIFRCLKHAWGNKETAICRLVAPRELSEFGGRREGSQWCFSPALLDACFWAAGGHLWVYHDQAIGIPQSIERLLVGRRPQPEEECRLQLWFQGGSDTEGGFKMVLFGADGEMLFFIDGFHNVVIPGTQAS